MTAMLAKDVQLSPEYVSLAWAILCAYVIGLGALAWWSRKRIHTTEDFLVAGRRLSLPFASATLFATWFGAGTLLVATDEIHAEGLERTALEPFGPGLCLFLAGWWIARPLWRLRLTTLADYFARRFGARAEFWAAALMVPSYFGWVATQLVALAQVLELVLGLPFATGLVTIAVLGTAYTMIGGLWSVTLTDSVQVIVLILGLGVLAEAAIGHLGGWSSTLQVLGSDTVADAALTTTADKLREALGYLGILCVGALGNLPGQDLTQRIFAARSETVASRACYVAGAAYLLIGSIPILLGLLAPHILGDTDTEGTITRLSYLLLSPAVAIVFTAAILSAVLSTLDSAILSPASVLAENIILRRIPHVMPPLLVHRTCIVGVAMCSLVLAFVGRRAYHLLESAYALSMVSLLVPLLGGLASARGNERAALASMWVGTASWSLHLMLDWDTWGGPFLAVLGLPVALSCTAIGGLTYVCFSPRSPR